MAARAKKKNLFGFGTPKALGARQTTAARGGSAAHAKREKSAAGSAAAVGSYGGYRVFKDADGNYRFSGDSDSSFDSWRAVKSHIDWMKKGRNPKDKLMQAAAYALPGGMIMANPETALVNSEIPVFRAGSEGYPGVEYITAYPELSQALAYAQAIKGGYPDVGVVCLESAVEKMPGGDYAVALNSVPIRALEEKQVKQNPQEIGSKVSFFDPHTRTKQVGTIERYERSASHPWKVYYVRTDSGSLVEVHPDRVKGNPSHAYIDGYEDGRAHVGHSLNDSQVVRMAGQRGYRSSEEIGQYVVGFKNAMVARKRNPEESAAEAYERFHGRPADRVVEITEELREHEWLAEVGMLVSLKVETPTELMAEIEFASDAPKLAQNEDPENQETGAQLFIVGGNQKIDLKRLKMDGADWRKESMVLGWIWVLTYQTEKSFDKFETVDYFHKLSEEERGSIAKRRKTLPSLRYDTVNEKLFIDGGKYRIKLPLLGVSPGIEN